MSREDSAGRRPSAKRPASSRAPGGRKPSPTRRVATKREETGRGTALTARAAILVLAVASVIVAVAVPFKIWLGQRSDISSLRTQTQQTEQRLSKLNAADKRWQDPSYIESQAHQRLHYVLPGHTSHVVLGRSDVVKASAARQHATATAGTWYSQFWQSIQVAGKASTSKSGHAE
jgi:cell division protein FtsB